MSKERLLQIQHQLQTTGWEIAPETDAADLFEFADQDSIVWKLSKGDFKKTLTFIVHDRWGRL